MLWILFTLVYLSVGPVFARHAYARKKYHAAQLTRCADDCNSHHWHSDHCKDQYCSCGYRNMQTRHFYVYASPMWPVFLLLVGGRAFITGGEYEPRDVKAARRAAELEKVRAEFEQRTQTLERAAGIRTD